MGTLGWLGNTFTQAIHPGRLCGLAMYAHNRTTLLKMGFSGVVEEDISKARKVKQETFDAVFRRVYTVEKTIQIENRLKKRRRSELDDIAGRTIPDVPLPSRKEELIPLLARHAMDNPDVDTMQRAIFHNSESGTDSEVD